MTREEAIEYLGWMLATSFCKYSSESYSDALDMAIAALREQDATDTNVGCKTNADHIRSMTDEELAKWVTDAWDCHECSEHERIGDHPLLKSEPCDQECERHCLDWLKQPYGGDA